MNADRVSEVYKGEIFDGSPTQRRTRDRVHWLCGQARGTTLDLGCSQGIATLLLAAEGSYAVGVDLEFDRLVYAERDRQAAPEHARAASFIHGDGSRLPFADASFDTVLMGEVLEHLTRPTIVIEEVSRVLTQDGRLVITVPFGFKPHPDHKQSFVNSSIIRLVSEVFAPTSFEVVDGYIRIVAVKAPISEAAIDRLILDQQPWLESEFLDVQKTLYDVKNQLQALKTSTVTESDTSEVEVALGTAKAEIEDLNAALGERDSNLRKRDESLEAAYKEVERLRSTVEQQELTVENLQQETRQFDESLHEHILEVSSLRAEVKNLEVQLADRDLHLAQGETALASAVTRLEALEPALRDTQRDLSERDSSLEAAHAEVERLEASLQKRELVIETLYEEGGRIDASLHEKILALSEQRREIRRLEALHAEQGSNLVERGAALEAAHAQIERLDAALRARGIELRDLGAKTTRLERLLTDSEAKMVGLEQLRAETARLENLLAESEAKMVELEQLRAETARLEKVVEESGIKATKLTAKLEIAETAVEASRVDHARAVEERNSLITKLKGYQAQAHALAKERVQLRNRLLERTWVLQETRNSRPMRMGRAIELSFRRPWRLPILPFVLLAILFGKKRSSTPPQLLPTPLAPAPLRVSLDSSNGSSGPLIETRRPTVESPRQATQLAQKTKAPVIVIDGPRPRRPAALRDLRVATILDDMSRACFEPECDSIPLTCPDWRSSLEDSEPDLLLVESAWQGNSGSWQYRVGSYTHPDYIGLKDLRAVLEWFHERDLPTVFWNKEDPVHFDRFKEAASLFDHVFTSDSESVARYRELPDLRATSVLPLPFAAQPAIHNPIGGAERSSKPCFAGTFYRNRHPERQKHLEMILDAARPYGLLIYDRMRSVDSVAYGFPERFLPHVVGGVPYAEIVNVYRQHKVFVNANSVTGSKTMFSRRVFELLACGTAVVSTPSTGIDLLFDDIVPTVESESEARSILDRLLSDDGYWRDLTARGLRRVMGMHTYAHRLATVAKTAGYQVEAHSADRDVAVIVLLRGDPSVDGELLRSIEAQTVAPSEIVIGFEHVLSAEAAIEGLRERLPQTQIRTVRCTEQEPAGRLRSLARLSACSRLLLVVNARTIPATLVEDRTSCLRFANADIVGSPLRDRSSGIASPEHQYTNGVEADLSLVRREVLTDHQWPAYVEDAPSIMSEWFRKGLRIYASGRSELDPVYTTSAG